jgi:hypothetical protein
MPGQYLVIAVGYPDSASEAHPNHAAALFI